MSNTLIQDTDIYKCAVDTKNNTENRRDEINKYYSSLFTAILSVIPFINKIIGKGEDQYLLIKVSLFILSLIGLLLSVSWLLTLKRIYHYMMGLDRTLIELETKSNQSCTLDIANYLKSVNSPASVTKQEMLVPNAFVAVFFLTLLYAAKELWCSFSFI